MSQFQARTGRLMVDAAVDRRKLRTLTVRDQAISFANADILILAGFCLVGLLASLTIMLALPNFAEVSEILQRML